MFQDNALLSNPAAGLEEGIWITVLVQGSSTSTISLVPYRQE